MSTTTRPPIDLNLLTEVIQSFCEQSGVNPKGKALISIHGEGDEADNFEALAHCLLNLDGRTVATKDNLLRVLQGKVTKQLRLMRTANFTVDERCLKNLCGHPSYGECQAWASAVVFLSDQEIARQKALWIGKPQGLRMLNHLNTWDRHLAYRYCFKALMNNDVRFQKNPAWLLPVLTNQFYHQTLLPWIERGLYER